jgi:hypothetical protein
LPQLFAIFFIVNIGVELAVDLHWEALPSCYGARALVMDVARLLRVSNTHFTLLLQ